MRNIVFTTIICLIPIFSLALLPGAKKSQKLEDLLIEITKQQSGTLHSLNCGPFYDGISCEAQITYSHSNEALECTNVYLYRGGEQFWLVDSKCQSN